MDMQTASRLPIIEHYANRAKVVERHISATNAHSPTLPTLYEESSEGSEAYDAQTNVISSPKREQHTVRDTSSLLFLKRQIESAQGAKSKESIKPEGLKYARRSTQNLRKSQKNAEKTTLGHRTRERKLKRAEVLAQILANNMADDELERLERIHSLEQAIAREEQKERQFTLKMKQSAEDHLLLRRSLWNLRDSFHHTDQRSELITKLQSNSYLRVPLLQYQLLQMAPEEPAPCSGQTLEEIRDEATTKVRQLIQEIKGKLTEPQLQEYVDLYQKIFTESMELAGLMKEGPHSSANEETSPQASSGYNLRGRLFAKAHSVRVAEEAEQKED